MSSRRITDHSQAESCRIGAEIVFIAFSSFWVYSVDAVTIVIDNLRSSLSSWVDFL